MSTQTDNMLFISHIELWPKLKQESKCLIYFMNTETAQWTAENSLTLDPQRKWNSYFMILRIETNTLMWDETELILIKILEGS